MRSPFAVTAVAASALLSFSHLASALPLTAAAPSGCSASTQLYNNITGFPEYAKGCIPSGYYQATDLGQTSPTAAQKRCETLCTSYGSECKGFLAQINKAADSGLYSGTCFFYTTAALPTKLATCADKPYLVLGEIKDATLSCFHASSTAASSFCSSYLGVSVHTTYTRTTTPVKTVTITSHPTVSKTSTKHQTLPTSTKIVTVVTTKTSVASVVITDTSYVVTSNTAPPAITVTARDVEDLEKRATTVPPPACVTADTPATRLSSACSCLSLKLSTTSKVFTAPTVTKSVTVKATITKSSSTTVTSKPTAVSTTTLTVTAHSTVTTTTTTTIGLPVFTVAVDTYIVEQGQSQWVLSSTLADDCALEDDTDAGTDDDAGVWLDAPYYGANQTAAYNSTGTEFYLDQFGHIITLEGGLTLVTDANNTMHAASAAQILLNGYEPMTCEIDAEDKIMCDSQGESQLLSCTIDQVDVFEVIGSYALEQNFYDCYGTNATAIYV
jgi:hypothetical protein